MIPAFIIEVTDTPLTRKPGAGRPAADNQFAAIVAQFDDAKVRTITPTGDVKVSTMLPQLRDAAREIQRSVSVELVGPTDPETGTVKVKDATAFRFALRPLILRPRTPKEETAETNGHAATVAPVAPVANGAPAGSRPAKRAAAAAAKRK